MCEELENRAQGHAIWALCDINDDKLTIDSVRQMLAEAYKQGYKDAEMYVCYNKSCVHRLPNEEAEEAEEAIPPYIQGIKLSEEQNNFFDNLIPKEEFRNSLKRNDK